MKHVYLSIITVLVSWCCMQNTQAQSTTTICTGGTAVLTATLSGGTDCTVLWEQSSSATGPWTATTLTESPTNVFTTPPLTVTTYYRAQYFCTGNGCDDPYASPVTEVIVVPDPVITVTSPLTVCSLTDLTVTTSGGAGTCTIQWQSSTTGTGGWTDISGANTSTYNAPAEDIVMYYRATYTCVGSSNCNPATSATITVNPRPIVSNQTATICSDVVNGVTLNSATNSVPISGYNITSINANGLTASAGSPVTGTNFTNAEISNDAWTNTTGAPVNVIYTIVPVSDASCTGDPFTVTITVNPEPVGVATPASQTVCSDVAITTIALTTSNSLTGTTFAWTRDNTTNITNLSASGSGDISGTPNNVTGSSQTTTYTITPTNGGCVGNDFTATVTVNPEPVGVATPASQTVCSDVAITTIALSTSNSLTGTTFAWTRDNTTNITNLSGSGSGDISGTPNNVTGSSQTTTYTITPTNGGCVGNDFTATVTVNPEPVGVATPASQTVCSDVAITTIALTTSNSLTGTTFAWTRDNTTNITNLSGSGSGDISGTPNNVTGSSQTTTYTITPTSTDGCVGNDFTATVTVNPEPVGVATPASQTVCSDVAITTIALTTSNSLTGTTFAWTRDNTTNITNLS
ncbi:MAG: hypothetical protein JNM36_17100, partial [Chitinophagales bacterium]|nr:hypothetical protein [Chitinophagales bacterium]